MRPYFDGFYQPVDNFPTLNKAKAGKTIPIRFSLGRDQGLDILAADYPKSETIPCNSAAPRRRYRGDCVRQAGTLLQCPH